MTDAEYLDRAVVLACDGVRRGLGGPFGAVVVHGGVVIAEACNEVVSSNDPTAHAEVLAIRRAAAALSHFSLHGGRLYASCEPCPMCLGAIHWARLDAVFYAASREDAARAGFDDAVFHRALAPDVPEADRPIPVRQLSLPEARRPFETWLALEDRTLY
jgi:guanine deaminase